MNFDLCAKRLKQLREEKGLSHDKLSKAISEKYGVKISKDSLIIYEICDPYHARYGRTGGMKIEYLQTFADFYNVSTDYILGRTDVKSIQSDIQTACATTGLSENAIKHLTTFGNRDDFKAIDTLLNIKAFWHFISVISECVQARVALSKDDVEYALAKMDSPVTMIPQIENDLKEQYGDVYQIVTKKDAVDAKYLSASRCLDSLINSLTKVYQQKQED